jgi:hypothetical protein
MVWVLAFSLLSNDNKVSENSSSLSILFNSSDPNSYWSATSSSWSEYWSLLALYGDMRLFSRKERSLGMSEVSLSKAFYSILL